MVKYTGKKSAASLINKLLGIAWYVGIIMSLVIIGGQLYLLIANPQWSGDSMRLQIETPGLVFSFTEGYLMPSAQKLFIYQFIMVIPLLAIGLLIIHHLRKIFSTLVDDNPFTLDNSRRIKVIGWAIIAATILKAVLSLAIGFYFASLVNLPGLVMHANIRLEDFSGVFIGIVVLILAEVFTYGARLQEEQNLTI